MILEEMCGSSDCNDATTGSVFLTSKAYYELLSCNITHIVRVWQLRKRVLASDQARHGAGSGSGCSGGCDCGSNKSGADHFASCALCLVWYA